MVTQFRAALAALGQVDGRTIRLTPTGYRISRCGGHDLCSASANISGVATRIASRATRLKPLHETVLGSRLIALQ